jgi:3-oxoacyl-[acyl-carrier protein] reductase
MSDLNNLNNKIALVTGASRGIGASVSRQLAAKGADIVINFRSKGPRAEAVADEIRAMGRHAFLAQADITDQTEVESMIEQIRAETGRLDLLILNASGGLEKDKPADYAMHLNHTSQERLVDLALPLMTNGGRIVFVTSHLAHFYGEKDVPEMYVPVAASKKAGEMALRDRIPEFAARGINLVVVSGDMIEGTITPKLMERANRGTIETRRQQAGSLPTVEEFAEAIVNAASDVDMQSGDVVFVGSVE